MSRDMDVVDAIQILWRALSRAEQCRLIDLCFEEYGLQMPVPAFEDAYDDAVNWRESAGKATQWAFMRAIFDGLGEEEQAKTIEALRKQMKGGGKAEPAAG